jgi:hypothetical protein
MWIQMRSAREKRVSVIFGLREDARLVILGACRPRPLGGCAAVGDVWLAEDSRGQWY